MSADVEALAGAVPQVYDFGGNWNAFYASAMVYHEATRPGDELVVQRIDTFRGLMSRRMNSYLGSFVRLHPRFNMTEGWDRWVDGVAQMLRMRGLLSDMPRDVEPASLQDAVAAHKQGKQTLRELWQVLDELVVSGDLSSVEQRAVFWDALTPKERRQIVNECAYADPQHAIWEKQDTAVGKMAEQSVALAVEFTLMREGASGMLTVAAVGAYGLYCNVFTIWWPVFSRVWWPAVAGSSWGDRVLLALATTSAVVMLALFASLGRGIRKVRAVQKELVLVRDPPTGLSPKCYY